MVKIIVNYTMTSYLGKGEYGKVFRAFHIDSRIEVAVKMIPLDLFNTLPSWLSSPATRSKPSGL